jgi:hypothetical protein
MKSTARRPTAGTFDPTSLARQFYTVWDFRSVDGKSTARVVRVAEPNDQQVQHEYQRIAGQVLAFNKAEALALVNSDKHK